MTDQFQKITQKHKLIFKLKPIFVAQLSFVNSLKKPAYFFDGEEFQIHFQEDEMISTDLIKTYVKSVAREIFISEEDHQRIMTNISDELVKMTRSLSIGDILKNCVRQSNLLSFQMDNLYRDPFNDDVLSQQFQSTKNLGMLLNQHPELHSELFKSVNKQSHHFVIKQPMLSSILFLSLAKDMNCFSELELQSLFQASYFKDIGMCFVSRDKWDDIELGDQDKENLENHTLHSVNILQGRVQLGRRYLNTIKNHNYLNKKALSLIGDDDSSDEEAIGLETTLINCCDIFVAMVTKRPYREAQTLGKSLEYIKLLIAEDYPQEYKQFTRFIAKFFKQ